MTETAQVLENAMMKSVKHENEKKAVVLVGSLVPLGDPASDAPHPVYFWPKKKNDMRRILATNICATFRYFVIKLSDDKKISSLSAGRPRRN